MIKILTIIGTRPEAIKMIPIIKKLNFDKRFDSKVVVTAQHRDLVDNVLKTFDIVPDYDLDIMESSQTLSQITTRVIDLMGSIYSKENPDIVLVHGDTTTAFSASVSAFYSNIKIAHVEAGLRTSNIKSPFPEEFNRKVIDLISDMYFVPTIESRNNLLNEGIEKQVYITGNTAIDMFNYTLDPKYQSPILDSVLKTNKIILLTVHRRESLTHNIVSVFKAIKRLMSERSDISIVFPVHPNPRIKDLANRHLGNVRNVHLVAPMDVIDFHNIMNRSYLILTDSGGIQEEACHVHVPTLVLRDVTERPEGIATGALKLVGLEEERIYSNAIDLLTDDRKYLEITKLSNPYGDGCASERILDIIEKNINNL